MSIPMTVKQSSTAHWTAIVTVFEVAPSIAITTGTAPPLDDPAGTSAFTWYSPTVPGARPENTTEACAPPIMTVGVVVVDESGLLRAAEPLSSTTTTPTVMIGGAQA